MKERTKLDGLIKEIDGLQSDLDDNVELIEMGELEGDDDIIKEAEAALMDAKARAGKAELQTLLSGKPTPTTAIWKFTPGPGVPKPRIGRKC